MKGKTVIAGILITFSLMILTAGQAFSQATVDQGVIHFGASFNKAFVDDVESPFAGADVFVGKMFTNNLFFGFSSGYDVVSFNKSGDLYERFGVVPVLVKAAYFKKLSRMLQFYVSAGGGLYRTLPHLGGSTVGGISEASTEFGGSISVGLDYWFLLTTGVGFSVEYHTFNNPVDDIRTFQYLSARIDYCLIKF